MVKYQIFMKGEGVSVRRNFETDESKSNIRFLLDEECDCENMEIKWIKADGLYVDIDKFGK